MKILVTGAKGFIGQNLVAALQNIRDGKDTTTDLASDLEIYQFDKDTDLSLLQDYCRDCDFVFNLAGVNRPQNVEEFMNGEFKFATVLLDTLKRAHNTCPVMYSSSIQAVLDNPYGKNKKAGEQLFFQYGEETGARVLVYRLPNVFGKWCKPNYNSVVATFCYNIANGLPITIDNRCHPMRLVYIDDVVSEMIRALCGKETRAEVFCKVPAEHNVLLGEIADLLYSFKAGRENRYTPDVTDGSFSKKLYSTYLSYLPENQFAYPLKMNADERGSFTEILRTQNNGQFSVNISKPGIVKGNHWHNTKNEKFLVVSGRGVIRLRKPGSEKVIEYTVSGDRLEVVDIPVGYTHNIENLGDRDMITFMWSNECFNPEKPDTYFLPVCPDAGKPSEKRSVLVLGGNGMAGYVVATYFQEHGYDVTVFDMEAVSGFSCTVGNATDLELLRKVVLAKPYCAVLNCIGLLQHCDEYRSSAAYLNGYLPHFLADLLKETKTKVIHISTDCVFSGKDSPYNEDAKPDASDNYGRTKAVGELDNAKDLTFRTSIIGPERNPQKNSLLNWLTRQEQARGFTNVLWTGVSTVTLARAMETAIRADLSGIYHLVNNDAISKYDLLRLFNQYFCAGKVQIQPDDSVVSKRILHNTRTDFDFKVPTYEEMVCEAAEWVRAHRDVYPHYTGI